jgi:hypothetical protein
MYTRAILQMFCIASLCWLPVLVTINFIDLGATGHAAVGWFGGITYMLLAERKFRNKPCTK